MKIAIFCKRIESEFTGKLISRLRTRGYPVEMVIAEKVLRQKYTAREKSHKMTLIRFKWLTGQYSVSRYALIRIWMAAPLWLKKIYWHHNFRIPRLGRNSIEYLAKSIGILLYKVQKHSSKEVKDLLDRHEIDYVLLVSSNWLIKEPLITMIKPRIINCHSGYLPKYRGLNAIEWSEADGGHLTGPTTHFIDEGIDTGPVLKFYPVRTKIGEGLNSIRFRVNEKRLEALVDTLDGLRNGSIKPRKQVEHFPILAPMELDKMLELDKNMKSGSRQ